MWQQQYEQRYMDIVLQHSDVVVGQLFGFLHRDHFTLMRADNHVIFPNAVGGARGRQHHPRKGAAYATRVPGQSAASYQETRVAQVGGWWSRIARAAPSWLAQVHRRRETRRVRGASGRRSAQARPAQAERPSSWRPTQGWFWQDPPEVLDGDSSAAVLIAPSLSPILLNRPAFRVFSYDRVGLLLDYVQHTADLKVSALASGCQRALGRAPTARSRSCSTDGAPRACKTPGQVLSVFLGGLCSLCS